MVDFNFLTFVKHLVVVVMAQICHGFGFNRGGYTIDQRDACLKTLGYRILMNRSYPYNLIWGLLFIYLFLEYDFLLSG